MRKAFGRGFDSRRLHHILSLLLIAFCSLLFAEDQFLTVFEDSRKQQISLQTIEGAPFVRLSDLQGYLGFQMNPTVGNQNISINAGSHNVILSANRSLVSVDQKLVSLSKPVYLVQSVWLVPLDFIPKVLRGISDKKFLWLESSKSLMLGNVQANPITLKYASEKDYSRLVFQSVNPVKYTVLAVRRKCLCGRNR